MNASSYADDSQYRVVLLTKAGVGGAKREVLDQLADTDDVTVAGIVVEDMVHGSLPAYATGVLRKMVRYRGRGYPVRTFYAVRDVLRTIRGRLSTSGDAAEANDVDGPRVADAEPLSDVPIVEVSDMTSEHAAGQLQALNPDLGIVWGTRILPRQIFDVPVDGSIGIHAGKIPEYRGGPAGFWELYNGEREAGVTVQKLNEELDAGQIIAQEMVPVQPVDSPPDVRARQHDVTADLVVEAVLGLADGSLEPSDWDGSKGQVNTPPTVPELLRFYVRRWRQRRSGGFQQ